MFLKDKNIALLGLGKENLSFLKYLKKHKIKTTITVCDFRENIKKIRGINYRLGSSFNQKLDDFDYLFRSPGWPLNCPGIVKAKNAGTIVSSPMNIFFQLVKSNNIIGITGSKGKGTTATLIAHILKTNGNKVFLGGNIGVAPFDFIDKIKKNDFVVLELSSFQLEDLEIGPRYAVITNFFKDHLQAADPNNPNYHSSLQKYWQAKIRIINQPNNKYLIINKKLKEKIQNDKTRKIVYFTKTKLKNNLSGHYNLENIAAAEELSKVLKINKRIVNQALLTFKNLEHRLELVKNENGIKYYNNSFSTNVVSTILDLKSFKKNIILIAGGSDKGDNFTPLAKEIKKRVKFTVLLPGLGADRINKELNKLNYTNKKQAKSMSEAVNLAKKIAKKGDLVLLSTACASFGIFKNYKERGDLFKNYVRQK
jgi:UDP-N-acetylmuramoylalanine--D-glutamate ligase